MERSKHDGDYGRGRGFIISNELTDSTGEPYDITEKMPFLWQTRPHCHSRHTDCDKNQLNIKARASSSQSEPVKQ
eukprot:scaffold100531_cov56-Attheya_sp.AAC.1